MKPQEIDDTFKSFVNLVNKDKNVIIFLEELLKFNPKLFIDDLHLPSEPKQIGSQDNNEDTGKDQRTGEIKDSDPV